MSAEKIQNTKEQRTHVETLLHLSSLVLISCMLQRVKSVNQSPKILLEEPSFQRCWHNRIERQDAFKCQEQAQKQQWRNTPSPSRFNSPLNQSVCLPVIILLQCLAEVLKCWSAASGLDTSPYVLQPCQCSTQLYYITTATSLYRNILNETGLSMDLESVPVSKWSNSTIHLRSFSYFIFLSRNKMMHSGLIVYSPLDNLRKKITWFVAYKVQCY